MKTRFLLSAIILTLLAACTKTEIVPVPELPQNRMLEYKIVSVPNGEDPIYGAIDEADSTITVYLSEKHALLAMTPEITLPEGAKVSPESGTTVINLLSMMRKDSTISYKVTAADGATRNYTLHVKPWQKTIVKEFTTNPDNPFILGIYPAYGGWGYGELKFTGDNFIIKNRVETIAVSLVSKEGREISIPFGSEGVGEANLVPTTTLVRLYPTQTEIIDQLVDGELYHVILYNYGDVVRLKNPIRFRIY
ncbi:MAG: hypothetical protein QM594_06640 [Niabella sp.]